MNALGLQPGQLTLLFGGSPCQTFSQIGKRSSLEDERGELLFQILRFADVFRPHAIMIEQVKGLLNAVDNQDRKGGVFKLLLERIEGLGYMPQWKLINAADYGVPQVRQRIFIIGTPSSSIFSFPSPTHAKSTGSPRLFPLLPYITVGEALEGLGEPHGRDDITTEDSHIDITPARDRVRIHGVPEGSHLAAQLHLSAEQRGKLTKKDTTKFRRLSRYEPSITLRGGEAFYHPIEDRYLTPKEYMRLHGYPDNYQLIGPIRGRSGTVRTLDQHRQVANSVPPPVAKFIAEAILGEAFRNPQNIIGLSDGQLFAGLISSDKLQEWIAPPDASEEPATTESFQDIIRAPTRPSVNRLIEALAQRKAVNELIVP
jgi:DNA (cytosine-5)-methyltransferase 1